MDFLNLDIQPKDIFSLLVWLVIVLSTLKLTFQKQIDNLNLDFTKHISRIETKLYDLEKKVDIHNNIVERTYKNEADIEALKDERK